MVSRMDLKTLSTIKMELVNMVDLCSMVEAFPTAELAVGDCINLTLKIAHGFAVQLGA